MSLSRRAAPCSPRPSPRSPGGRRLRNRPLAASASAATYQTACADNAGASPLIANRTAIGPWESFQPIHNSNGAISLLAKANNMYVTAENAGASSLIANRTAIGTWEQFTLIND